MQPKVLGGRWIRWTSTTKMLVVVRRHGYCADEGPAYVDVRHPVLLEERGRSKYSPHQGQQECYRRWNRR